MEFDVDIGLVFAFSINEDGNLDDENISDATESNTTKSFIEHENDIGCSDGITEITSKCLAVSLDDVLCKEGTSKIPEVSCFRMDSFF